MDNLAPATIHDGKIFHIRSKPMTYSTRKDYVRVLKEFFRLPQVKNTPLVDDVTVVRNESEQFTIVRNIITDENMLLVLSKCESLRDWAGCLLRIRKKDVFKEGKKSMAA